VVWKKAKENKKNIGSMSLFMNAMIPGTNGNILKRLFRKKRWFN